MCDLDKPVTGYACDLSALKGELKSAHIDRSMRLFAKHQKSVRWHETGLELTMAKNPEDLADVTQWAHDESLCCPFLRFSIEVQPGGKPVVVRVSEPEGAAGFLRSELKGLGII